MPKRSVRLRARAASDIAAAVSHYRRDAGETVALAFVEALEQSMRRIRTSPNVGSLRFSYELDIPELRAITIKRFPYRIFYVTTHDTVDVWRVLHGRRDLPATLVDDG